MCAVEFLAAMTKVERTPLEYANAEVIIDVVCQMENISFPELIARPKGSKVNILRGIAYLLSREYLIHPSIFAEYMHRSRCNVINVARTYQGYLKVRDKLVTSIFNRLNEECKKIIKR